MSIVRKVERWPPRLATHLALHNDNDGDEYNDDE